MNEICKRLQYLTSELKNNKFFYGLIILILVLQALTYPSIHHITTDEGRYINESKNICNGDFSDFFGYQSRDRHEPLYNVIICATSIIHGFNLEKAEIVTYSFFVLTAVSWYFTIPKHWKVDKKKFLILILSNSLLWVYSFRVLLDVPVAFFLSLGIFNLYLFFKEKLKRNYYLGCLFISLALLTKIIAILYIPIFFVYLLLKRDKNFKNYVRIVLPLIPFIILTLAQYITGFPILSWGENNLLIWALKITSPGVYSPVYSALPYAHLPTVVFIIGIFSPLIVLLIFIIKNEWKNLGKDIKSFILFFFLFYILWEIVFDFIIFANMPRYHTTLMPFFALIISAMPMEKKSFRYIYYLILLWSLVTGFFMAYYFHIETEAIWKIPIMKYFSAIIK